VKIGGKKRNSRVYPRIGLFLLYQPSQLREEKEWYLGWAAGEKSLNVGEILGKVSVSSLSPRKDYDGKREGSKKK